MCIKDWRDMSHMLVNNSGLTMLIAENSDSNPIGSPFLSLQISPICGFGVSFVIPAISNAFELSQI